MTRRRIDQILYTPRIPAYTNPTLEAQEITYDLPSEQTAPLNAPLISNTFGGQVNLDADNGLVAKWCNGRAGRGPRMPALSPATQPPPRSQPAEPAADTLYRPP